MIVGASLAGLRAAAALRDEGFTGSLTLIGDEPYRPYDRPPLSKQVLEGWVPAEHTALPGSDELSARWRLGVPATGLDPAGKQVRLADGSSVEFDRLLITTGTRARPWPNRPRPRSTGCSCCAPATTRPACQPLAGRAPPGAGHRRRVHRLEVASACRDRDIPVTVAERGPAPWPALSAR